MELRARGWSIRGAGREVGVSRATAKNWTRGYNVYRDGKIVRFVPPLDRLEVRQISARFLSQDERIEIADLHHAGMSIRSIARRLGRAPSTISRELRRNAQPGRRGGYRPFDAHRRAALRRARLRELRVDANAELGQVVSELLRQRWSPEQISRHLRIRFVDAPEMRLCHESIYRAVYRPGSRLMRPTPLAPGRRSPLRTGRDHRRAHQHPGRRRPRFEQPMLTVHQRPFTRPIDPRPGTGKAISSSAETRAQRSRPWSSARPGWCVCCTCLSATARACTPRCAPAWPIFRRAMLRSITWDQGTEMARHTEIAASLGVAVYFCDSHSPWQRGTNENTNGLLRDYFPKGTDLAAHSPEHLLAVEDELNRRPRIVLGDQSPLAAFNTLLAS
jgi:transposase, IS30 family